MVSTPSPCKVAKQAEHYKEMVEFMEKVSAVVENEELTVEECNLLFVAYKNKEESRGNEDHIAIIQDYHSKLVAELSNICNVVLKLLNSCLIPLAAAVDLRAALKHNLCLVLPLCRDCKSYCLHGGTRITRGCRGRTLLVKAVLPTLSMVRVKGGTVKGVGGRIQCKGCTV
ncbi:14-3-3 protein A [Spatholobus suberectus]|nr:14-3-3 protein A [Spatholobus suberectus]